MEYRITVSKTLSKNDTGETNSHQSGISIPKKIAHSGVFPELTTEVLNPRTEVFFEDESGIMHKFQYIYYNDKYHGKEPTKAHDEYRLTCVKDFIRDNLICSGDSISFSVDSHGDRYIGFSKTVQDSFEDDVIHVRGGWKIIEY